LKTGDVIWEIAAQTAGPRINIGAKAAGNTGGKTRRIAWPRDSPSQRELDNIQPFHNR
jgi:hypothetical protein